MAISISISITQNSQSITNNTSNVTVKVNAKWTYGSYNKLQKSGWLTIDGTKYTFTSSFNTGQATSGSQTLFSKTVNVKHAGDGTKKLTCSASYTSGVSSGTVTASASKTLTTIARASTLTASNGTLGVKQKLTVTRYSSSLTHTITYTCGTAHGTICDNSTDETVYFTPPLSLASQNTTGVKVSVELYISTFNGDDKIGSKSVTITCTIPASVKPSCSLTVTDAKGYADKYGAYVKGQSKFAVTITPTTAYGSAIASYNAEANGATYAKASFTTGVLTSSGTLEILASVKDKRGRTSDTASAKQSVIDYAPPQITLLKVKRCDADGTENIMGEYAQVTFSAEVTALNNLNSAKYKLEYKKQSETEYTAVTFNSYTNEYEVTEENYIFEADSGSTYNVRVTVVDDFTTIIKPTVVSTGEVLMHWRADGKGMGLGKVGEIENGLDVGYVIRANKGFVNIPIEEGTDFNDLITPNTYISYDKGASTYVNCPVKSGTFKVEVTSGGNEGQIHQTVTYTNKTDFKVYHRQYHSGDWAKDSDGNYIWNCVYSVKGNVLWSGGYYMTADHTATLSEPVSTQPNGIVLVFSRYVESGASPYSWQSFFVPKHATAGTIYNTSGHTFILSTNNFSVVGTKYLYIRDTNIAGNENNNATGTANGITYNNAAFVLRYVIGV